MMVDSDRACYGPADVTYADSQLAVAQLLITDTLFKAARVETRKAYVALVESVREHGGQVGGGVGCALLSPDMHGDELTN